MNKEDILHKLCASGEEQQELFRRAREIRDEHFPQGVCVRGVIETTNLCTCNCDYCPMRRDNLKMNEVYSLNEQEILGAVQQIRTCGIHTVFLQAGETPMTTGSLGEAIGKIRSLYDGDVAIILNLGVKTVEEYAYLYEQGATGYILKFETSDSVNHERLRHESYEQRIEAIRHLLNIGYSVGTGMIIGLPGQTLDTIADDILLAQSLKVQMCSVSPFLPAPNTPLQSHPPGSIQMTLNAMAIMRLLSPDWLIPSVSALEKISTGGQVAGLRAGANVITVNYTPKKESDKYHIYGENRFVVTLGHALQTIEAAGLNASIGAGSEATGQISCSKEKSHESISG